MKRFTLLVIFLVGCGKAKEYGIGSEGITTSGTPVATILCDFNAQDPQLRNEKREPVKLDGTFAKSWQVVITDVPPEIIWLSEVVRDWKQNRLVVTEKYQGKRIRLIGQIESIEPKKDRKTICNMKANMWEKVCLILEFSSNDPKLMEIKCTPWNMGGGQRILAEGTFGVNFAHYTDCKIIALDVKDLTKLP